MKKLSLAIAALCLLALFGLALCACVSSKAPSPDAPNISVGGVLKNNDRHSYCIIVGEGSKNAQTFFLVKDPKNAAAWKELVASVGKKVSVRGKLVQDGGPWSKTVAAQSVSLSE